MIFITGGAGYIASHTCVELLKDGFDVTVFDNFCNSNPEAIARVQRISGKKINVVLGDIRCRSALIAAIRASGAYAVIHFAGLKAAGESVQQPFTYYDNNVSGTLCLLEAMSECNVKMMIFSSSAAVYGVPQSLPLTEAHPLSAINPYARTKMVVEELLRDVERADPAWRFGILRYFNAVGAHESGQIGEDPQGVPNNLMPHIAQVAVGRQEYLNIFGNDYPTHDGTGVRDYIHVVDLACGHLKALEYLQRSSGSFVVNLGTGKGYSVLDLVMAFERVSGKKISYQIGHRRAGDVAACYADPSYAQTLLGWKAERDIDRMSEDTWRWQRKSAGI
ncbi:UDP-glucose 4-epimerase [Gammaproteobacteria bacterium]